MATKKQLRRKVKRQRRKKRAIKQEYKAHLTETHYPDPSSLSSYIAGGEGIQAPGPTSVVDQVELTHNEIKQQNKLALKRSNRELFARNKEANKFARDRYGIAGGKDGLTNPTNAADRADFLMSANDTLKIKPDAVDPTRAINKHSKRISKAFASLDGYMSGVTNEVDNTFVRSEVARLREFMERAGNDQLAQELDSYLYKFTKNRDLTAGGAGNAIARIRELQNHIRDSYNVDYVLSQTNGNVTAALNTGLYRVHEGTQEVYNYKTAEQIKTEGEQRVQSTQDFIDSDYEPGSIRRGSDWANRMDQSIATQTQTNADAYQQAVADSTGLPWWAK